MLQGRFIEDLSSFFCSMGEAVNGAGGYFGWSLDSLQDCCVGGFGVAPPFIVRWEGAAASRRALGHVALHEWAEARLLRGDPLDEDGKAWLLGCAEQAARGEGETLFDFIVEAIGVRGSTVEER
ncbi:barstar family protein [Pyxidicoccus xibeiensis]|uniref:barstar family protein n=1 Tax=Pyxidicoccus xibeiensis TaxID=2906759 RepID=UPI0020A7C799|nr:barstar family protein [Pyxidicoccus xibeiensis]MCP3136381.1 barstar family protein [Pyxidicoccus xibeiensis]